METFETLKQCLHTHTPEPPTQIDSFIKAAARQHQKKQQQNHKKRLIFWSTGIAAAFAVSFSCLYLHTSRDANPEMPAIMAQKSNAKSPQQTFLASTTDADPAAEISELGWNDVMLELSDLSDELNDADMEVAAFSAWNQDYAVYDISNSIKNK